MSTRIVVLAVLLAPAAATAQDSLAPQAFHPAMGPRNFLTVEGARVEGSRQWSAGALASWELDPFVVYPATCNRPLVAGQCPEGDLNVAEDGTSVVEHQFLLHLMGTMSFMKRLQVGLDLPLALTIGNEVDPATGGDAGDVTGAGLSDPRIEGKYRILGGANGLAAAASLTVTFPFASIVGQDASEHVGNEIPSFIPRGIVEWRRRKLQIGANLGVDLRYDDTRAFSSDVGTSILWGLAGAYDVGRRTRAILEVFGTSAPPFEVDVSPIEVDAAGQFRLRYLTLTGGVGVGLTSAIGAPTVRVFVGGIWYPHSGDRDGDGIDDARDECKDDEEDEDGFLDSDGCPEEDNDADGKPDTEDECPNEAEDVDEHEDGDGCPDPDNDGDGVADGYDSCPNVAEDKDEDRDDDGCPDEDTDGDGVNDIADRCPEEAEDTDGSADDDGCPDPDNDGDGVPDASDQCDSEAEDRDGVQDDDGCPDPDAPRGRRRGGG